MTAAPSRTALLRALGPLLAYLLLAHLGAVLGVRALVVAALPVAATLWLAPALWHGRRAAWGALAVVLALAWLAARAELAALPPLLLPVLGDFAVAGVFAASLRTTPLIARFVAVVDGPQWLADAAVARYARRLTVLWAVWMAALGSVALLLALLATPDGLLALAGIAPPWSLPRAWWSWYANVANYVAVVALFALEYAARPSVLPQVPRPSLAAFATRVIAHWRSAIGLEPPPQPSSPVSPDVRRNA